MNIEMNKADELIITPQTSVENFALQAWIAKHEREKLTGYFMLPSEDAILEKAGIFAPVQILLKFR